MSGKRRPISAIKPKKPHRTPAHPSAASSAAERQMALQEGRLPQGCTPAEKRAALEALAELHGVRPIDDPADLTADFWPQEESADQIVSAIRALRRESK